MRMNGIIYKVFRAPRRGNRRCVRVQLGPGQTHYLNGWINVDANMFSAKCDVWSDFSLRLPFQAESVDAIYSHHVIEHLPNLPMHFEELFRILKHGGVIRLGGPNGDAAMREYVAGNTAWFSNFPDARKSIGGRFENFIFCRQEHLTILTPSFLEELASDSGFCDIKVVLPTTETGYPDIFDTPLLSHESENCPHSPHTLLIEARKA